MRLGKVGRISASLRHGEWDDETADVEPFSLEQLSEVVLSFHGLPIYGWEFIDPAEGSWQRWRDRLSLDETLGAHGTAHHIDLFQAGGTTRHLDLRVWFDDLIVYDMAHTILSIEDFVAGGRRWWDALYAGDDRVQGHGIIPMGGGD